MIDLAQAFDKVWYEELAYKLSRILFGNIWHLLNSYLTEQQFRIHQWIAIEAEVPQGSVLGPLLYLLHTKDLLTDTLVTTGTFTDDTAILAVSSS